MTKDDLLDLSEIPEGWRLIAFRQNLNGTWGATLSRRDPLCLGNPYGCCREALTPQGALRMAVKDADSDD